MAGSSLIGALRVTLGLDSAAFEKGANKAIHKMDAVERAGYRTGRALRGLAGLAATAGLAVASAFTTQAVKGALDYAASIGEVSAQLGITTKELQVYRYAATQVNLTEAELEKSLAKLTLSIGKAGAGAVAEARSFETLGISIRDTEGNVRPTGEILLDLADRLAAIPDPAGRAAAAYSVLGRAGQKLIPLLEGGSDGLKEFARQAEAAGVIIAEGDIAKADETADKIEALTTELKVNFSREVAANADAILSLASALAKLVGWLFKAGSAYTDFWGSVGRAAGRTIREGSEQPGLAGAPFRGIRSLLARVGIGGRKVAQPPAAAAEPELEGVDLEGLFGGGGGGGGKRSGGGRDIVAETGKVRENLTAIRSEIEDAFDTKNLPRSVEQANELRERLAEIGEEARKNGVPMAQFSGEVAGLQQRIAELELEGVAREAEEFSEAVFEVGRSVDELDQGALTPMARTLSNINDRFEGLKAEIREQIDENAALAEMNDQAALTMARLRDMLIQLEAAHGKATAAAVAQYQAEEALRDIAAQQLAQGIKSNITDLSRARGDQGLFTPQQQQLQATERQLQEERLSSLLRLREMEADLQAAQLAGDEFEAERLAGLIGLQQEYYDLVSETTAQQIVTSQRLQDAFTDFTEGLSSALFDMVTTFEFSLQGIADVFLKLLNDVFLKPATDSLAGSITGFLQGMFAGGFATGGVIPRGQWGIVGENGPEPVFAGDRPLSVMPNESLGAGRAIFNITVQGKMGDREARRTGSQIGSAAAKRYADARKAGIAG